MNLTTEQKKTVLASFLGWMLDAFDFFLLSFVLVDIAKEFDVGTPVYVKLLTASQLRTQLGLAPPH